MWYLIWCYVQVWCWYVDLWSCYWRKWIWNSRNRRDNVLLINSSVTCFRCLLRFFFYKKRLTLNYKVTIGKGNFIVSVEDEEIPSLPIVPFVEVLLYFAGIVAFSPNFPCRRLDRQLSNTEMKSCRWYLNRFQSKVKRVVAASVIYFLTWIIVRRFEL